MAWWLPGVTLIAFGVLIAVFPQLLSLIVSAAFIVAGVNTLLLTHNFRKAQQRAQTVTYRTYESRY